MTPIDKLRDSAGPARGRLNYAECDAILAERDRLLAVVAAAKPFVAMIAECRSSLGDGWPLYDVMSDSVSGVCDLTVGQLRQLAAALDQLDRPREEQP